MDIAGLEDAAEVRLVRCACSQALDGGFLIAEGFKEGVSEIGTVKGLFYKLGNRLLNLYSVQPFAPFGAPELLRRDATASLLCSATYSRISRRST
jgi:hypothetical protein